MNFLNSKLRWVNYSFSSCLELGIYPCSSMVERSAVNRNVTGSSPVLGVIICYTIKYLKQIYYKTHVAQR